jgi:hypothetical protein
MSWTENIVHLLLILAEAPDRGLHPCLQALPLMPERDGHILIPTKAIQELTGGLSRPYRGPFGHDAIDRGMAAKAIVKAAGLTDDWGICAVCKGHAIHPDDLEASEAWEETDPPTGDGWQLWTTTTEGSPITPVFATAEELADYAEEYCTMFADIGRTSEQWLRSFLADTTEIDSMMVVHVREENS